MRTVRLTNITAGSSFVRSAGLVWCLPVDAVSVLFADGRVAGEGGLAMLMEDLKACGFPDILIQSWKDSVGDTLLPLQEKAIREFDLLGQSNLIISAPTSSGKTFCGEIAMARALTAGRKAVYLVPLKALAEERYHDFQQKYARLGLKTIISTGDRRKHDFAFQRGDFDLAVVIFEKFSQLLTRNLDILSLIDLILIDELQMIGDSGRGSSLELLLLKIKVARYNCRLVGLSAVLSSSGDLANWLSAGLLTSSYRPVDLYQGVLWQGRFDYRSYNSGQIGSELVLDDDNLAPEDQLLRSVVNFIETGEKVLVFLKSRVSCQYFAESITDMVEPLRADDAIKALSSGDRTGLGDKLIELLEYGVAFHHADLSFEQRRILEHGFRAGKIRVIFATTTLAMGLNLPAGVVFLEPFKFAPGCYHKRLLAHHLNWSEYENMCGRAGRLRYTDRPGKALLLVNSEFEKEVIWNKFMLGKPSEFEGHLAQKSTADLMLDLVASGCCRTLDDVAGALQKSFSRAPFMDEDIKEACEFCYKRNFIVDREGACESTALGDTIAGYGISCATADQFLALLARSSDLNEACWLYELVTSGEMTDRARFSVHGRLEDVRLKQIQDDLKSHGLVEGFSLEQ
ncbi:MAG: DEAD/DEAH box helicase, partial [candidate division Zixibacteria bacterium]|nr:DEAD/DEAH box helicase [candidate division Zixibacteria bacterium]